MKAFLSFDPANEQDRLFAQRLSTALRRIGIRLISANLRYTLGDTLMSSLSGQMREYDHVIAVHSRSYLKDPWLQKELFALMTLEQSENFPSDFVIPIRLDDSEVHALLNDRAVTFSRTGEDFNANVQILRTRFSRRPQVFVAMAFTEESRERYELAVEPVIKAYGFDPLRIDDRHDSGHIFTQILREIGRSAIFLCDLTGERPNCYLETGYAMALGKPIIFVARDGTKIHFDLGGYRCLFWKTNKALKDELPKYFKAFQTADENSPSVVPSPHMQVGSIPAAAMA